MNRPTRHPVLAALFAFALLAGGVGAVQAQQADPAPPDVSDAHSCPMTGADGAMEGMDMQAMMKDCPMMQDSTGEGMMGMMSMMKDCPMMKQMMKDGSMMDGMMRPDSTMGGGMRMNGMMPGGGASHHGAPGETQGATAATVRGGVQTAAVTVGPDGFAPQRIALRAGVPARLVFTRTTDRTCATEVQVPALGVGKTALPLGEPVAVTFTPTEAGTYAFTCGMGMMRGSLVVAA